MTAKFGIPYYNTKFGMMGFPRINESIDNVTSMASDDYNRFMTKEQDCQRVILDDDMFEVVDYTDKGVVEEDAKTTRFIEGRKYALSGVSCEGFDMEEKVYELVKVHDTFDGVSINSVIMKQVSGTKEKMFTLSKNDCECIGIEYEQGLQIFPKDMRWRIAKEEGDFDKHDLSTNPTSDVDGTIRYVLVKINGFKDYSNGYIVTPSGKLLKEEKFKNSLTIYSKETILYNKSMNINSEWVSIRDGNPFRTKIVYPTDETYNHGNFITANDEIYVLIYLTKKSVGGVEPSMLKGFDPNKNLVIFWDEKSAISVEDFAKKEERAKLLEKRKAERLEKERLARANRRKNAMEAVETWRQLVNRKIVGVDINDMSSVSLIEQYAEKMSSYLDEIDDTIGKIDRKVRLFY